jgi:metal-responsive CopG/Arc/MetJ family transcriptional regulator
MTTRDKSIKAQVTLPPKVVEVVDAIAKREHSTRSRVLARLAIRTLEAEGHLEVDEQPKRRSA